MPDVTRETRGRRAPRWLLPTILVILTLVLGTLQVAGGGGSPYDEHTHFDYAYKVAHGELPPKFDTLGQEALRTWACDPFPAWQGMACGAQVQDPARAPFGGESYVTEYMPTYYVPTAIATRVVHSASGASWLTAARIANLMWFVAFALLMFGCIRMLGSSGLAALGASLLAISLPLVVLQMTHVTNDAGALVAVIAPVFTWLATRSSSTRTRLLLSFGIAVLALTVKQSAVGGLVAITALEALGPLAPEAADRRRRIRAVFAGLIAVAVYLLLVLGVDPWIRGVDPQDPGLWNYAAQGEPSWGDYIGANLQYMWGALASPVAPLAGAVSTALAGLVAVWAVGVGVTRLANLPWRGGGSADQIVSAAGIVALLAFPLVFAAGLKVDGRPLILSPRYLTPGVVLCLAAAPTSIRGRRAGPLLLACGAGFYVWTLVHLLLEVT